MGVHLGKAGDDCIWGSRALILSMGGKTTPWRAKDPPSAGRLSPAYSGAGKIYLPAGRMPALREGPTKMNKKRRHCIVSVK